MAAWGRNATPVDVIAKPVRYGLRSIGFALLALACVLVCFAYLVNLPSDASERVTNIASIAAVVAYFVVAPVLHVAGFIFGVLGVTRASGKASSIVGIVLNVLLFGLGVLLIVVAGSGLTAFR